MKCAQKEATTSEDTTAPKAFTALTSGPEAAWRWSELPGWKLTRLKLSAPELTGSCTTGAKGPGQAIGLQSKDEPGNGHGERKEIKPDMSPLTDSIEKGVARCGPLGALDPPSHYQADK